MFMHVMNCGDIASTIQFRQLTVTVLNTGKLRRSKVLTFQVLWNKRMSFPIDCRFQTEEITPVLLQMANSQKSLLCARSVVSFKKLKAQGGFKELDGEILRCVMFERSLLDTCGLQAVLSRTTFTKMVVTRQVGSKRNGEKFITACFVS